MPWRHARGGTATVAAQGNISAPHSPHHPPAAQSQTPLTSTGGFA